MPFVKVSCMSSAPGSPDHDCRPASRPVIPIRLALPMEYPDQGLPAPPPGIWPPIGPAHPIQPAPPGTPPGVVWPPIGTPPVWPSHPIGGGASRRIRSRRRPERRRIRSRRCPASRRTRSKASIGASCGSRVWATATPRLRPACSPSIRSRARRPIPTKVCRQVRRARRRIRCDPVADAAALSRPIFIS